MNPRKSTEQQLMQLANVMFAIFSRTRKAWDTLKIPGRRSQAALLRVIAAFSDQDRYTIGALCRRVHMPKSSMTEMIKKLEAQGLVQRQRASDDERVVWVSLTHRGRGLNAKLQTVQHIPSDSR